MLSNFLPAVDDLLIIPDVGRNTTVHQPRHLMEHARLLTVHAWTKSGI
jgi:hypothetical protein